MTGSTEDEAVVAPSAQQLTRSRWRSFGLRWLALYLLLYNVYWILARVLPGLTWIDRAWTQLWDAVVLWVGPHLLRLKEPMVVVSDGSGDRTADYIQVECMITLALVGAAVWVWFDRTNKHDWLIYEVTRVGVRYVLAAAMLAYGFSKIFHLQMP